MEGIKELEMGKKTFEEKVAVDRIQEIANGTETAGGA